MKYKVLVGKPEGKRPLGKRRGTWEYDVRMNLREIRWEFVDWKRLAQDRDQWRTLVKTVIDLRIS
jgi:hypothetical protein